MTPHEWGPLDDRDHRVCDRCGSRLHDRTDRMRYPDLHDDMRLIPMNPWRPGLDLDDCDQMLIENSMRS